MRDLTLAIPSTFGKRKTKTSESTLRTNIILLFSILILGLGYLFLVNSSGTKGYEIRKLDQQLRAVQADQKNLEVEASDLQSIDRIQQQANQLNFVPTTSVTYLKDSDFALK